MTVLMSTARAKDEMGQLVLEGGRRRRRKRRRTFVDAAGPTGARRGKAVGRKCEEEGESALAQDGLVVGARQEVLLVVRRLLNGDVARRPDVVETERRREARRLPAVEPEVDLSRMQSQARGERGGEEEEGKGNAPISPASTASSTEGP